MLTFVFCFFTTVRLHPPTLIMYNLSGHSNATPRIWRSTDRLTNKKIKRLVPAKTEDKQSGFILENLHLLCVPSCMEYQFFFP